MDSVDSASAAGAHAFRAVAIGVSTGGVHALQKLLGELPATFPLPILIVQHISADADSGLAKLLNDRCALRVKEADERTKYCRHGLSGATELPPAGAMASGSFRRPLREFVPRSMSCRVGGRGLRAWADRHRTHRSELRRQPGIEDDQAKGRRGHRPGPRGCRSPANASGRDVGNKGRLSGRPGWLGGPVAATRGEARHDPARQEWAR
jgi:hypothetical protein